MFFRDLRIINEGAVNVITLSMGSRTMKENIIRTSCRLCGSSLLKEVISIGEQYVNDFPSHPLEKGKNGKCPLDIVVCENCSLFQLRHTAPQELLYSRHYWYKSGINEMIKRDLLNITEEAINLVNLKPEDVFIDIGANDGTLLSYLEKKAIRVAPKNFIEGDSQII